MGPRRDVGRRGFGSRPHRAPLDRGDIVRGCLCACVWHRRKRRGKLGLLPKTERKRSLMRRATVCDDGGLEDPDAVPSMHVCHLCRVLWCRATGRRSRADHPNGIQMMCLVRSIVGSRAEHRPRRFVQRRPRRADAGDVDDSRKHSSMAAHRDIPEAARVGDARDRRWHHRFHACRKGNSCGYTVTTRSHHYRAHRVSIGGRWAGYRSRGSCRPCWLAS